MIAGRDLYNIHHFFLMGGNRYLPEVIVERTGKKSAVYIKELIGFIKKKINDKIITEDLNFLLPPEKFKLIKRVLKKRSFNVFK